MKKTKVINFTAGPGAGKSTTAAGLFHTMKKKGDLVELVSEYAKDMVWEERGNILEDQLYILAKQNRRLSRLIGKVDYIITDSPIILCGVYAQPNYYDGIHQVIRSVWASYDNITYYIKRSKPYVQIGRGQTEAEARLLDTKVRNYMDAQLVNYTDIFDDVDLELLRGACIIDWSKVGC